MDMNMAYYMAVMWWYNFHFLLPSSIPSSFFFNVSMSFSIRYVLHVEIIGGKIIGVDVTEEIELNGDEDGRDLWDFMSFCKQNRQKFVGLIKIGSSNWPKQKSSWLKSGQVASNKLKLTKISSSWSKLG